MAPVADRTEGANIGSLTDGSVGRARRGHKKAGGEEGGRRRRRRGRGAGPVSARWRARPRNFSVVFRGPWSSGPEMKAEPPLNAAAGLRSKIPLPPTRTSQSEKRSFVYVCTTSRRNFTSLFAVSFRPLLDPTLETHAIFSFSFSSFLFDHLLFHSLFLSLFFFPFLFLSGRFCGIRLESPPAAIFLPPPPPPPRRLLSLHLLFFPPCFLLRCLPLVDVVSWESGPPSIGPLDPPARRSIGIRGPAARGPRSRSLARKIRGAVGPVRSRRLRFCALMPTPSSFFSSFFFFCSNFLSPPIRRFNGPMRERISMISCSLAEERLRFGEGGGLIRCLDGSEGFDCCSIEHGDGKRERERYSRVA